MPLATGSDTSVEQDTFVFPAASARERLWFLDELEPHHATYTMVSTARIRTALNREALEQSLNTLIQRHEILRTIFLVKEGQLVQAVAPTLTLALPMVDLQPLPQPQQQAEVLRFANQEAQQPFDLSQEPLLKLTLFRLEAQEHLLLLSVHPFISDSWFIGVFFQELALLYQDAVNETSTILPDVSVQHTNLTDWQQERLNDEKIEKQLVYWQQQLSEAPAALELPTDRPRSAVLTHQETSYLFTVSRTLTERLAALSRQEDVTLFMTLTAALQGLLHRYTGQDDLLLGTVTAQRKHLAVEGLVGFFPNTLVLRTDLSGNPTFRELLSRVREITHGAQANQDIPFEYLSKQLHPDHSSSYNPFFQALLTLEPPKPTLPSNWSFTEMNIKMGSVRLDLNFELQERPEGLLGNLKYNSDLFDETTIARLVGHWQCLLQAVSEHPELHLSDLPLLAEAERQQLLVDWNATACNYPQQQCIQQVFEAQVERTPEAIALIFEEQHLTYRQLNEQANQLAHYLQHFGVGPEVRVGLCIERSLEMVVGLLGILKAGGAYVPLDPVYPQERLAYMLEDAQTAVLVTRQELIARLPQHKQVVCLDTGWNVIARESKENIVNGMTGENLAYLLYTSGSTGRPKGVLGTHRAAINRFSWMWKAYPFEPEEVCCQKTALSFVDSVWEIFGPLLQGIRTVIIPDMAVKSPEVLLQVLATHAVTRIVLVPSLLRVLLDLTTDLQNQLPTLKYWICSGETLPLELALSFVSRMPHSVLLNLYGSSEVAADATCYDMREGKALTSVPIGRPIANTQIYLLDRYSQLVPIGVPGELHVGGDGLARGYFNRPDLTSAKFVPNPFSTQAGTLLYKTGDWARFLPDGNIEYLGRLDHQVKIRGFRVELGEIEAVLNANPAVQQSVVMAREDVPGDKRLVAYVVIHRQQSLTVSELQEHLTKALPNYMVPSAFLFIEAFPLLPNGKVDRHALPVPDQTRPELQQAFVAPHTPIEESIASIWSSILGIERVGIHDNFFDLGGHSLLATQVIAQLQKAWRIMLPLRSFFESPTVAGQAQILALAHASDGQFSKPSIRSIPRVAKRVSETRENSTS